MYRLLLIKRRIEDVFIFPFILFGRLIALLRPLKKEYRVFFFFPFYHTGGAEKVHAQITQATGGNDCIIFFTKKSVDDRFLNEFKKTHCDIKNISKFTDNKWLYFLNLIYRGIISSYINSQNQKPIIFNGQCNFGYKISPWIRKPIPQIELIHSLNTFSYIRIPFLPFITKTVMISKKRIEDHKELYDQQKIPLDFANKINYIPNAIELTDGAIIKPDSPLTVLYVGRDGPEKRVQLIAEIAKRMDEKKEGVNFEIAGDVSESIKEIDYPFIKFHGNVNNGGQIRNIYSRAHILVLASTTEGFPLVIMEAMAAGCAIISTPVGDIPYHIKNNENGFLFRTIDDEQNIVMEAIEKITWLKNNRSQLQTMAVTNIVYASHNFGIERFNKQYKKLFLSVNPGIETP